MRDTPAPFSLRTSALFGEAKRIRDDADALLRRCRGSALEAAGWNARQEDFGLLPSARAGHWSRVAQEIARRAARDGGTPALRRAA